MVGLFVILKNITRGSKSLQFVQKVAFYSSPGLMQILLMSELKIIDFIYFHFILYFYLFFIYVLIWDLELGVSVMSHINVTNCYISVTYQQPHRI